MRRMIVAIVILLVILTGIRLEGKFSENVLERTTRMLDDIESAPMDAGEKIDVLKHFWSENEKILDTIITHDETDEIALNITRCDQALRAGDEMRLVKNLYELKERISQLKENVKVDYRNIF